MFQSKYYRRPPWNTHFLRIKALTILGVLVTFLLTFFFGLAALFVISVSIFFFFGLIAHLFVKSVLGRSNPEEVAMEKTWKFIHINATSNEVSWLGLFWPSSRSLSGSELRFPKWDFWHLYCLHIREVLSFTRLLDLSNHNKSSNEDVVYGSKVNDKSVVLGFQSRQQFAPCSPPFPSSSPFPRTTWPRSSLPFVWLTPIFVSSPPHFWKIILQFFIMDMVAFMQGGKGQIVSINISKYQLISVNINTIVEKKHTLNPEITLFRCASIS